MPDASPRPRRLRASLSLRGLMLFILVVGVLLGGQARKASQQRRAATTIMRMMGDITYDFQSVRGDLTSPFDRSEPHAPRWIRRLIGDEYFQEITGVFRFGGIGIALDHRAAVPAPGEVETLMASLATLDRLQTLVLQNTRFTPPALAALGRLTGLRSLGLNESIEDDAQLATLRSLVRLEKLSIELDQGQGPGSPILQDGLGNLAALTRLKSLDLEGNLVRPRSLDFIEGLADLEHLKVDHSPSDDAIVARLAGKSKLRDLVLPETRITDAGMAEIGKLVNLEWLEIAGEKLTDAGLAHLAGLTNLKHLELGILGPGITDTGLAHLASLTQLETLQLTGGHVTDAGLVSLAGMTGLRDLRLSGMPITDAGLVHLSKMFVLFKLDLSLTQITGTGLVQLPLPTALRYLNLEDSPVNDVGLAAMSGMTSLHALQLGRAQITDAGLPHLSGLKNLEFLNLDETAVTQAGVGAIRSVLGPTVIVSHEPKP